MIKSFPFNAVYDANGVPDRAYLTEDFAGYFAKFIGTGVYPNPATGLQVVAVDNNMQIRIKKGDAYILGRDFENTDDYILKLDPADGVLSRIDRVALRLDYLKRDIIPVLKKGQYASSPVAKSLQRDADAYEIALADVYVKNGVISIMQSNITDTRLNSNVCGIVHGTISQVDTTEIFRQFQAWFNEQKNVHEGDFEKWVNEFKIATGKKFTDWVDDLKNSLDPNEDIAAKLQMQISENKLQLADITKQIDNIDLSADKVTLNSSNIKSKNVKGALEELFTSASNGKNKIVTAITGKGIVANNTDSFDTLSNKIKQIPTYAPANLLIEVKRSSPITIPDYDTIGKIALDVYGKIYCKSTKILSKIDEDGYIYWQYTHDRIITSVTVKNGYVYIADWEGNRIIKINSSSGEIIWNNRYSSKYGTESIVIDDNNIIYAGTDNGKVIKIDSTGEVIWTYDKHKSRVDAIAIDKNGYIYSGGGNRLVKLCSNGGEEWIRDFGRSIASIAIDNNGYVYNGIAKINPDNGEQIWHVDLGLNISANSIFVDDYVYVASSDKMIRKISLDGLQIWKYYCDYNLRSIIKRYSYIYIGHDKIVRKLTDEIYVKK
ncbi:PQQ-binding-like beta-propeller repeat protein [Clostridium botulinum]|uniref:outer membrane protein assembly factor BamB family protein n=1 Tax=Clostridium botulinum TaxID=1491 RepID=UPI00174A1612|nr:PQQ-binding-like beta-propeller repeat protein [Clostridium botulinum]MBD5643182.1 PQQ-binding-like beta-propeller repeat protein [Clostridium botulinum]